MSPVSGRNHRGVTLVELLAAVALVVMVVSSLTFLFPTSSKAITINRQRLAATEAAQNLMLETKKPPYALINPTPAVGAYFPNSNTGGSEGNCDCNQEDLSTQPPAATSVVNGIAYTLRVCINFVDPASVTFKSFCPNAFPDAGIKTIHVRVTWNGPPGASYVDLTSKVAKL